MMEDKCYCSDFNPKCEHCKEIEISNIESGIDSLYGVGCDYLDDYEPIKRVERRASYIWKKKQV